jgi:hypothetical protein
MLTDWTGRSTRVCHEAQTAYQQIWILQWQIGVLQEHIKLSRAFSEVRLTKGWIDPGGVGHLLRNIGIS